MSGAWGMGSAWGAGSWSAGAWNESALAATGQVLAEGTPTPSPSDGGFDAVSVSPGLGGFIMMFLLAVAVLLLVVSMSRKIRRIQARERVAERMHREDGDQQREPREE